MIVIYCYICFLYRIRSLATDMTWVYLNLDKMLQGFVNMSFNHLTQQFRKCLLNMVVFRTYSETGFPRCFCYQDRDRDWCDECSLLAVFHIFASRESMCTREPTHSPIIKNQNMLICPSNLGEGCSCHWTTWSVRYGHLATHTRTISETLKNTT